MNNEVSYPLPQPAALRFIAKVISYVFHPLFIPAYVCAYLIFKHPYTFPGLDQGEKMIKLISLVVITAFFPAITVFLLWRLKFADSIFLRTQKERIIPYITSIIYFFWAWYVNKNQMGNPPALVFFLLGLFLAASAGSMANNYFKISMHAIGVGGGLAFMILLGVSSNVGIGLPISIATIIAGLVCTARFIVSDHRPSDVYSGLFIGALAQLVAWYVVM
jgi:hypothetical protein